MRLDTTGLPLFDAAHFQAKMDRWVKTSSHFDGTAQLPDVNTMAKELERGIWAKWIPGNLVIQHPEEVFGFETSEVSESFESPGRDAKAGFNIPGIPRDSGVGDFGAYTTDKEIQQVVDWASKYRPKRFS